MFFNITKVQGLNFPTWELSGNKTPSNSLLVGIVRERIFIELCKDSWGTFLLYNYDIQKKEKYED